MDKGDRPTEKGFALRFIRDEPAKEDTFLSHKPLATTVAKAIRGVPDLEVVGLVGEWGSGKSTVARMVREELEAAKDKSQEVCCFEFDAWLHQSDTPRRAFLEAFIGWLLEKKYLVDKDIWKKKLAALAGQVEETDIITTPSLTVYGALVAASFLLIPVGLRLVDSDVVKAAWGDSKSIWAWAAFVSGCILISGPFFITGLFYLSWRPPGWPLSWNSWIVHNEKHSEDSILSIFVSKERKQDKIYTVRSPSPTAIEFQKTFREAMSSVQADGRRFIFFIDNLDRLPEDQAEEMWSTVRSLLLRRSEASPGGPPIRGPTVVLPFASNTEGTGPLSASFMDKTFDLLFRVPPPVTSSWREYLDAKLQDVFEGTLSPEQRYRATFFLDKFVETANSSGTVTPRKINTIVNRIAILWLQWKDKLAFEAVAFYAIWSPTVNADNGQLIHTWPEGTTDALGPDWIEPIAALYFGIDPSIAVQVYIEPQLHNAVRDRDEPAFASLAAIRGFDRAFGRILEKPTVDGPTSRPDAAYIGNAASLFGALKPASSPSVAESWRRIRAVLLAAAPWKSVDASVEDAIRVCLAEIGSDDGAAFLQGVAARLQEADVAGLVSVERCRPFTRVARQMIDFAKGATVPLPMVTVPGRADEFLRVVSAGRDDPELLGQLRTETTDADLIKQLDSDLRDARASIGVEGKVRGLLARKTTSADWSPLMTAASETIQAEAGSYPGLPSALACLGLLRGVAKNGVTVTNELATSGNLLTRFHEASAAKIEQTESRALALLLLARVTILPPGGASWEQTLSSRPQLASQTTTLLDEYGPLTLDALVEYGSGNEDIKPLVRAILNNRLAAGKLDTPSFEKVVSQFARYAESFSPETSEQFYEYLAERSEFWAAMESASFLTTGTEILHRFVGLPKGNLASSFAQTKLDTVTEEEWKTALRSGGEPLSITNAIAAAGHDPLMKSRLLAGALRGLVAEILPNADPGLRSRWFAAAQFVGSTEKSDLLKALADQICNGVTTALPTELLSAEDDLLVSQRRFVERAEDALLYVVTPLLLARDGLPWLRSHSGPVGGWVEQASDQTKLDLRAKVSEWQADADETTRAELAALASDFHLPPASVEPEGPPSE